MRFACVFAAFFAHCAAAAFVLMASLEFAVRTVDLPASDRWGKYGLVSYASDGSVLAAFLAEDERWRFPIEAEAVDAGYMAMLLAYEDRNFQTHRGVDITALLRAGYQAVRHGRTVSGASTLTMQLVRLLDPKPRRAGNKLLEMLQATKLERRWSKQKILEAYLSIAPFGGNIEGIRAASLIYLGKEPGKLTLEEAALLVALPQAPESRRPDRAPAAARAARDRVLATLARRGFIDPETASHAVSQPFALTSMPLPKHAPHMAQRLAGKADERQEIHLLIDRQLQQKIESFARARLHQLSDEVNIAILVVRNTDGAVVGYVGSGAPGSVEREGDVDLVRAIRSPGSALKPFVYAMAFEGLIVHPDTIVADQPIDLAGYRPYNADGIFSGDMTIRESLVRSKNTVPVMLLDRIGTEAFLSRFRTVGSPLKLGASDNDAGLAVALGGVGISLEQLTWFYSAFANEGELRALRRLTSDRRASLGNLFEPGAANAVADILADVPPPVGMARLAARDGSRRVGFKTGTSYGFRDAWAVGFDKGYTVGVWIGRPDGAPHLGAYGVTAAAPVLMNVFDLLPLPASGAASGRKPLGALVSPRSLPERLRRFGPATANDGSQELAIAFPKRGAQIAVAQTTAAPSLLPFRVSGGRPPFRWSILGHEAAPKTDREYWAAVRQRGEILVQVTDADGKTVATSFWLE